MAKVFRPSSRESSILTKIESSKEHERRQAIRSAKENADKLSNAVATKLIEADLVETTNKNGLEDQIKRSIEKLSRSEEFDIDYQIAPIRNLVQYPNIVSLYLTSFVIEQLINHKDVVDIFGSDEDIYHCINRQITK